MNDDDSDAEARATAHGFIYGLQAASWQSGEIIEPGLTKIGSTRLTVSERVAQMQSALGAGGVHRLVIAFEVRVADLRVEQAVHAMLKREGRHVSTGSAREWFCITPENAEKVVRAFANVQRIDEALATLREVPLAARNRSSIGGPKEIKMTPKRAEALKAVRAASESGGSPSDFAGGRWGAAATALAVEEGISKDAALVLMREWFL